jgi:hypothetical protein
VAILADAQHHGLRAVEHDQQAKHGAETPDMSSSAFQLHYRLLSIGRSKTIQTKPLHSTKYVSTLR